MSNSKLTEKQRLSIAAKYSSGISNQSELANEFEVTRLTINRICRKLDAVREEKPAAAPKPRQATVDDMGNFLSRAHSILWRSGGNGDEYKDYHAFDEHLNALMSKDGGGLTKNEAVVMAAKEFPCLESLFKRFNVKKYDPSPESHPGIQHFGDSDKHDVECEDVKQSYRENLRWAIEAAGTKLRTGVKPETCPCDSAWFLYEQAISDPKDFLSKLGQIESKVDAEDAADRKGRKAGEKTIAEIDGMLAELETENKEEREDAQSQAQDREATTHESEGPPES